MDGWNTKLRPSCISRETISLQVFFFIAAFVFHTYTHTNQPTYLPTFLPFIRRLKFPSMIKAPWKKKYKKNNCKTVSKMDINETLRPFWNWIMYMPPWYFLGGYSTVMVQKKKKISPIRFFSNMGNGKRRISCRSREWSSRRFEFVWTKVHKVFWCTSLETFENIHAGLKFIWCVPVWAASTKCSREEMGYRVY